MITKVEKKIQFLKRLKVLLRMSEEHKEPGIKMIRLNHTSELYTEQQVKEIMAHTWRALGRVK